jgi:hypothetical protein
LVAPIVTVDCDLDPLAGLPGEPLRARQDQALDIMGDEFAHQEGRVMRHWFVPGLLTGVGFDSGGHSAPFTLAGRVK